jgi:hypothetical protein
MVEGALGSIEGPRTLRYFAVLLLLVVIVFIAGVLLAQYYGFRLLAEVTRWFIDNPMVLLDLAGLLALVVLLLTVGRFALQFVDEF